MFNPNSAALLANEVKHDFAFEDNVENLHMNLALAETTASEVPTTTPAVSCNCPSVAVTEPPKKVPRTPPPPEDIWYLLLCVFGVFVFSLGVGGLSVLCDKKEEKKEDENGEPKPAEKAKDDNFEKQP